jgi:hypothetical protein
VLSSDIKEASFVAANRSSQHVCNRGGFFCLQISSPSRIMRASGSGGLIFGILEGIVLFTRVTPEVRMEYWRVCGEIRSTHA